MTYHPEGHYVYLEVADHYFQQLGGGSYLDIRISAGITAAKFYSCFHKCIDAVLDSKALAHKFPSFTKELDEAAQGFQLLKVAIKGCVACKDGYLLQIKVPASSETGNVKAYFSGHY